MSCYMDHGDWLFGKLLLDSRLDLPANLSTRKIPRSSIRWVITIISVHVHVGVAAAHGFNHRSHISPLTPIASVRSRYRSSGRECIHRSPARSHGSIEGDPNSTIFPSWGTVDVGCNEILDVKHGEGELQLGLITELEAGFTGGLSFAWGNL